ncbi:MAG: DUF378 domain-containing protein [Patescibacteria group bacterium]
MKNLNFLDWLALILLIVGGLNWALVGIFEYDLVASIFGELSAMARVVYVLVGLAAVYQLLTIGKIAKK